jgi:hypothetical protein
LLVEEWSWYSAEKLSITITREIAKFRAFFRKKWAVALEAASTSGLAVL